MDYNPSAPATPPSPPAKKGLPVLAWIAIGCIGLIVLGGIAFTAVTYMGARWVKNRVEEAAEKPVETAAKMIALSNPDIQFVSADEQAKSATFRDKKTGKELTFSLDDIENRILRPIWRDTCVHYALNCASIGCPNLQKLPFSTDLLTRHLDGAARAYVNDPRGVTLGPAGLVVSSIYVWYQSDFGGTDNGVIRHLMTFAEPNLAMRLQDVGTIAGDRYDWRLNDAR